MPDNGIFRPSLLKPGICPDKTAPGFCIILSRKNCSAGSVLIAQFPGLNGIDIIVGHQIVVMFMSCKPQPNMVLLQKLGYGFSLILRQRCHGIVGNQDRRLRRIQGFYGIIQGFGSQNQIPFLVCPVRKRCIHMKNIEIICLDHKMRLKGVLIHGKAAWDICINRSKQCPELFLPCVYRL